VTNDEIIIPNPNPNTPIKTIKKGNKKVHIFKLIAAPENRNKEKVKIKIGFKLN
jgi:hypothetical protein